MRLIDAEEYDSLLREYRSNPGLMFGIQRARNLLKKQKSVDAVPVVRCRECKKHGNSAFYPDRLFCQEHGRYVDPDGYCYLGERKEGADNEP